MRSFALLATDGAGRLVAAWNQAENGRDGIFVRRFGRAGSLDRSFGRAGTLHLDCGCYLNSLTALTGGRLLVGGESEVPGRKSTRWLFARLLSNGAPDGGFGDRGQVLLTRRFFSPSAVAPTPGGGVLLAGLRQRGYDNSMPYVLRLSSSGRIDGRYGAATRRALHGVYETGRDDVGWEGLSLVSRPGGGVTVFGRAYRRGIAVGLLPDGGRDRSFGKGGVTLLPFDLSDAVTDGRGGAFAVGYLPYRPRRPYAYAVLRVQGDGRISRGFGRVGLPDAYNEYGLSIFPSDRGPVVLARGESVCRGYCPSHPRMFRLAPLRGGP